MNNILKYIGITLLFLFSFYYTNKISDIIKNNDPIMKEIKSNYDKTKIEVVNATIEDDTITPGKNGCEIDLNKSYKQMKKINKYTENMLKYRDLIPAITINNIYNKYISNGNRKNRNVSFVVYVKNNLDQINKINDIKLNIFIDINLLNNKSINISNNKKIYNGGDNNYYDDVIVEYNDLIASYNKPNYCLNLDKNDNNLLVCSLNRMHSVKPEVIIKDNYNSKYEIKNGSIIYFDENNIDKINIVKKYVLNKGYDIVYLDELLDESNSC